MWRSNENGMEGKQVKEGFRGSSQEAARERARMQRAANGPPRPPGMRRVKSHQCDPRNVTSVSGAAGFPPSATSIFSGVGETSARFVNTHLSHEINTYYFKIILCPDIRIIL